MTKPKMLTPAEFAALRLVVRRKVIEALEREKTECAIPDLDSDPETDLWDFPKVDSKTVAKLSPLIKELIGWQLKASWIRKGGYSSNEEAADDLLEKVETHCVIGGPAANSALINPSTLAS